MWTEEDRRNLAALYREDDRLRAEREEEARQSAALPQAPVVRKEYSDALVVTSSADEGEKDFSGWENWMRAHKQIERELILETVAEVLNEMQASFDAACDKV